MENVWGYVESTQTDSPSTGGQYLKAEIIDDEGNGEPTRRHDIRAVGTKAAFLVAVYAISVVVGYVGGSVFYATVEAIESFVGQPVGGLAHEATVASAAGTVPVGSAVVTENGLRIRCAGSFTKPGKGKNGEPTVVVALEVQNISDDKVIMRKGDIAAIGADGEFVEPLDQMIARGDKGSFHQFTSVAVEPGGEHYTITASFYEVTRPTQLTYRPFASAGRGGPAYATFDIGGAQEAVLA
ncbi:MAG: hypothetical protein IJ111_05530 [Eggerthellaceae bacterium]|nr:hypothetical protein [Eggerthellaceae bacterium]